MQLKRVWFFIGLTLLSLSACEKEITSPGHGAYGSQLMSMGLIDWGVNEIKIFSGSKGVILDGLVRGGGLKLLKVVMLDTITNNILYTKEKNIFTSDLYYFKDTVFIPNIVDTIFAKITIEGKDANEMKIVKRRLKIVK